MKGSCGATFRRLKASKPFAVTGPITEAGSDSRAKSCSRALLPVPAENRTENAPCAPLQRELLLRIGIRPRGKAGVFEICARFARCPEDPRLAASLAGEPQALLNSSQHRLKFVAGIKSLTGQRIGTNKLTTMFTKRMKETPFLGVLRVLRSEQCRARPAHAVSEPPYLLIAAVEDLGSDGGQEFVDDHAFAPG